MSNKVDLYDEAFELSKAIEMISEVEGKAKALEKYLTLLSGERPTLIPQANAAMHAWGVLSGARKKLEAERQSDLRVQGEIERIHQSHR